MTSVDPLDVPASLPAGVLCAACDHLNPARARFCNACGSPVHHAQCPYCEAINDGGAHHCHKCQKDLRAGTGGDVGPRPPGVSSDVPQTGPEPAVVASDPAETAERNAPPTAEDIAPALTPVAESTGLPAAVESPGEPPPSTFERAAAASASHVESSVAAVEQTEPPLHYMGMLTAPADEAELERADPVADQRARRARKVRYAAAALLILPSVIAGAFYALEHQDKVDALVEYTRVAVVAPLVRAASSVLDSRRDAERQSEDEPAAPEPPATKPGSENTLRPSAPAAQSQDQLPHDAAHAAEANGDASATNTAR